MYTEQQLADLVASVEREFNAELEKAESLGQILAKAEDAPPAKEDEKSEEKAPEEKPAPKADGEEKAPEAKEAAAKPEGEEAAAPAAEAQEGAPASEEAPAADAEACDYDEEDLAHMAKMYSSMSKGELMAHHDAVRAALDGKGMEKCGEAAQAAPAASASAQPEMTKSEKDVVVEVSNPEVEKLKAELAAEMQKSEVMKKNFDGVAELLTKLVKKTAPQGKAITNLDAIAKSESTTQEITLTKSEITAKLLQKSADPTLSKSDRDAINGFYLGSGSINSINHLLK